LAQCMRVVHKHLSGVYGHIVRAGCEQEGWSNVGGMDTVVPGCKV
jgi:hypothetical protein